MVKKKSTISAKELDEKFDAGEDITEYLDLSKGFRPGLEQKRVNVDLPIWMIEQLDVQAKRIGVTRQSIVKVWLSDRLKAEQLAGADTTR